MWNPNIKAVNIIKLVQMIFMLDLDTLSMPAIPTLYNFDSFQWMSPFDR